MTANGVFVNATVHRNVAADEVIFTEGDMGEHMFGIVEGRVELRKHGVTVAVLGPGDVFGERALIDHLPRDLTAVATGETTLAEIDRRLFLFLVHETPMFALEIMGALATRLRALDELISQRD